ncbi:MAG TPA: sugar kinase [Verrucomicrobiota bacterium]|nr:sugar kinase [Verrucomicrobiota bacterium]HNU51053.1 sugar kinase [Verrucomicrobiota bacterium]
MTLSIRSAAACRHDVAALGECMVRLAPPGHGRLEFARQLEVDVGGGEYNVAYACARLGLRGTFLSALPDHPVARIILNHARSAGLDVSHVRMERYDGVGRRSRLGLNFTEVGTGIRPSVTLYDRGHSAASQMRPEDVDWAAVFEREGCRWLHTGGIFTALSATAAATVKAALQAADAAGTVTSYDLNFRGKLWGSEQAIAVNRQLIPHVRVLIGNEEDFQKALGFEVEGVDAGLRALPVESYRRMVERVVREYPNLAVVGTTLREVKSGLVNHWSGLLWHAGRCYEARAYRDLEIEDRVGGGDGFSSGVAYGFLTGLEPQAIVDFAVAHGALLQTTRGDTSQTTLAEVRHVLEGGTARIQR